MEVRRTSQFGQSDDFLLQGDFTGLSPDLDQTSSGIWSSPMESIRSPTDCPLGLLELAGSGESPLEKGGSVKYIYNGTITLPPVAACPPQHFL